MFRCILFIICCSLFVPFIFAQQPPSVNPAAFTPPGLNKEAPASASVGNTAGQPPAANVPVPGSKDSVLGERIARITANMERIPQEHGQIWREYDITPYTKGRQFPADTAAPEQTVVDWIIRQTGLKTWHGEVFSILSATPEKLYVYHTKETQLIVADVVDRFLNPSANSESCTIRVISLSRPDWLAKNHQYLKPIPIVSPSVQGWILEKQGAQLLLQSLGRRTDFKELAPPQFLVSNGVAHNVVSHKARTFLRDVQQNTAALNGYAEDRGTINEGFSISFVPLSLLDGLNIDAMLKLDIVQVEKMLPQMLDVPTAVNPRQRVQIETPQISCFKLDEQIRWSKNTVLLLDLGTIPLPNLSETAENQSIFAGLRGNTSGRANILLLIESVPAVANQFLPVQN
ncbi:MAG: hypothetical protein LBN39_05515 [Planctomycetaceae bacterium]|jgi:hypothetical protein|nr:hypothetical protein [Planctomycetaceae bacterium]